MKRDYKQILLTIAIGIFFYFLLNYTISNIIQSNIPEVNTEKIGRGIGSFIGEIKNGIDSSTK